MKKLLSLLLVAVILVGNTTFSVIAKTTKRYSNNPVPVATEKERKTFRNEKPKVKGVIENYWGQNYLVLSWKPVDHAMFYQVLRKTPDEKQYKKIGIVLSEEWSGSAPGGGKDYQYAVRAVTYSYEDKAILGNISDPYTVIGKKQNSEMNKNSDYDSEDEYSYTDSMAGMVEADEDYLEDDAEPILFYDYSFNTEEYAKSDESGFKSVTDYPLSTFSADVDTASYANLRRLINSRERIPSSAIRIEEMLNYFNYDYKEPTGTDPFSVTTGLSDCPWNSDSKLLSIGIKGKDIPDNKIPASNLVFLVDVSGSMYSSDKLPLVKQALINLAGTMGKNDRLSIVIYAGTERVILEGAKGSQINTVKSIMSLLEADGSTNGESGILMAYDVAEKYFIENGNNRIIMATDGDLNVGVSSEGELKKIVEQKRETGVYLSILGFGTENIKDNKMKALAANGNGNYNYIDSMTEADKVLVKEKKGTLFTIAKDVKFQVEFNPKYVKGYRLIGYDYRVLDSQDFANDKKDAGDIGAGHTVTALYEIIPSSSKSKVSSSELKYQKTTTTDSNEWLTVKLRYKNPGNDKSSLITKTVSEKDYTTVMSNDMKFAAGVAEVGMILKESSYKGTSTLKSALALLNDKSNLADPYKNEFNKLVMTLDNDYQYD